MENKLRKRLEDVIEFEGYIIDLAEECLIKEVSGENNADKKKCLNEIRATSIKSIENSKDILKHLDKFNSEQLNELNENIKKQQELCIKFSEFLLFDICGEEEE